MNRNSRRAPGLLVALLVLTLAAGALAQGNGSTTVLVDKDRNALVTSEAREAVDRTLTSEFKAGCDIASGLSTLTLQGNAPEEKNPSPFKTGTLSFYSDLNNSSGLVLADWKFSLPPDSPFTLTGTGRVQSNKDLMHTELQANVGLPDPGEESLHFRKLEYKSQWHTNASSWVGKLTLGAEGSDVYPLLSAIVAFFQQPSGDKKVWPVKGLRSLKLIISEAGGTATAAPAASPSTVPPDVLTTVNFEISADTSGELGGVVNKWTTDKDKIADWAKQFITGGKGQVESVNVTKAEVAGTVATFGLEIKARKLRDVMGGLVAYAVDLGLARLQDVKKEEAKGLVEAILCLQAQKLEIQITADTPKLAIVVDANLQGLDRFMPGYTRFAIAVENSTGKQAEKRAAGDRITTHIIRWWTAIKKNNNEVALKMSKAIDEVASSKTDTEGEGVVYESLEVSATAGQVKDAKVIALQGTFKKDINPKKVAQLREAMTKHGIVFLDKVGLSYNFKTDEKRQLTGQFYFNSSGDMVRLVKAYFIAPAQEDAAQKEPALKALLDALDGLKFTESRWAATLQGGKFDLSGYAKTSDLTALFNTVLQKMSQTLSGTPTGYRLQISGKSGSSTTTRQLAFSAFMPGKPASDLQAVGTALLGGAATADDKADAAKVALKALQAPDVKMPQELAGVKAEGDKFVFAVVTGEGGSGAPGAPGAPGGPTGSAGEGGSKKTGFIVLGVVGALVVLGLIFMSMSGRKR